MRELGAFPSARPGAKAWPLVTALAAVGLVSAGLVGCAMMEGGNTAGAVTPMQIRPSPFIARGDQSPDGYYALGKYYFYQGRLEKARRAFLEAIRLDPGHVDALNGLGAVHDRLGQYEAAQKAYGAALLKDPGAAHVWANLGYSLMLAGRIRESIEPLQTALRLDPDNELARQHLANANATVEKVESAPTIASVPEVAPTPPSETAPKFDERHSGIVVRVETPAPLAQAAAPARETVSVPTGATLRSRPPVSIDRVAGPASAQVAQANPVMQPTHTQVRSPGLGEGTIETGRGTAGPAMSPTLAVAVDSASAPSAPSVSTAPADTRTRGEGPVVSVVTSRGTVTVAAHPVQPAKREGLSAYPGRAEVNAAPAIAEVKAQPASARLAVGGANATTVSDRTASRLSGALGGLRIEVSNGNGVTGMARAVGAEMRRNGLNVARITNARPFNKPKTLIVCRAELKPAALELARAMPAKPKIVLGDIAHRRVDVRVVLGADSALARREGLKGPYLVASLSR